MMAKPVSRKSDATTHVTLIGAGTIGISFAVLHLRYLAHPSQLTIYDPAGGPHTIAKIQQLLAQDADHGSMWTGSTNPRQDLRDIRVVTAEADLPAALASASIVQEQGPENLAFKQALWPKVEQHAPPTALLWSSTSGIPASQQAALMSDPGRLTVVHPYNPPHVMPLLEVVPSPQTTEHALSSTLSFWRSRGRSPVLLRKEIPGFVANRLAFALLREAVHLVDQGVVGVADLDAVVTASMGPRWAVAGPFRSYAAGGGQDGLRGFFRNIGGTVQQCWEGAGTPVVGGGWEERVFGEAEAAFPSVAQGAEVRNRITAAVLEVVAREGQGPSKS